MPLSLAFTFIALAFVAGALCFRKNPLKGARTLDELEGWYHQAQAKIQAKLR